MIRDKFDAVREDWARERPDLDPSEAEVFWRITYIHKQLDKIVSKRLSKLDLPIWAFDVVAALRRGGPPFQASPSALCTAAMLTTGAMTNRLDRLEESGLVERLPDPDDRRGILIRLTAKGRELVDRAIEVRVEQAAEAVSTLTAPERKQLNKLLRKLVIQNSS